MREYEVGDVLWMIWSAEHLSFFVRESPYAVSKDGKAYLNTSEGKVVLEDISFGTERDALLYEAFSDMNPNIEKAGSES